MRDLGTMLWKESAEFVGNPRFMRVFGIAVLAMGVLPALAFKRAAADTAGFATEIRVFYALFAALIVVAQTAPDLVLHERVGHTLDYLLTTRLPSWAIFSGKVLAASLVGYLAAMLAIGIQLAASAVLSGTGWSWLFLSTSEGRLIAFGMTAGLCLYIAVIGTFVALRVGEQRAAYMATVLSVGVLMVPFFLGWLRLTLSAGWIGSAALVLAGFSVLLALVGMGLFHREMLVLYLQE